MNNPVITVGVDGSTASADAVRFALEEAKLRGATVRAVTAWEADTVYASRGFALLEEERALHEEQATTLQNKALHAALQDRDGGLLTERRVVRGRPGRALVELSKDAALLVVGTEHKGALKRAVEGSISAYCAKYSRVVPVVVVPFVDKELYGHEE